MRVCRSDPNPDRQAIKQAGKQSPSNQCRVAATVLYLPHNGRQRVTWFDLRKLLEYEGWEQDASHTERTHRVAVDM